MRRKVTLNLDERFIQAIDDARGDVPRSRFIERPWSPLTADPALEHLSGDEAVREVERIEREGWPVSERSPEPEAKSEDPREAARARSEAFSKATQR